MDVAAEAGRSPGHRSRGCARSRPGCRPPCSTGLGVKRENASRGSEVPSACAVCPQRHRVLWLPGVTRHSGAPVPGRWLLLLPRGPSRPLSSLPLCFSAPFKPALSPTRFPEPFPVPVPSPRPRSGLVLRLVLCCRLAASYSSSGCRCIERCFHLGPRAPDRGPERPPPPPAASRGLSGLRPPPSLCFSSYSLQRFSGLCVGPSCAGSSLREAVGARSGGLAVPDVTAAQGHRPLGTRPRGRPGAGVRPALREDRLCLRPPPRGYKSTLTTWAGPASTSPRLTLRVAGVRAAEPFRQSARVGAGALAYVPGGPAPQAACRAAPAITVARLPGRRAEARCGPRSPCFLS